MLCLDVNNDQEINTDHGSVGADRVSGSVSRPLNAWQVRLPRGKRHGSQQRAGLKGSPNFLHDISQQLLPRKGIASLVVEAAALKRRRVSGQRVLVLFQHVKLALIHLLRVGIAAFGDEEAGGNQPPPQLPGRVPTHRDFRRAQRLSLVVRLKELHQQRPVCCLASIVARCVGLYICVAGEAR